MILDIGMTQEFWNRVFQSRPIRSRAIPGVREGSNVSLIVRGGHWRRSSDPALMQNILPADRDIRPRVKSSGTLDTLMGIIFLLSGEVSQGRRPRWWTFWHLKCREISHDIVGHFEWRHLDTTEIIWNYDNERIMTDTNNFLGSKH